jgi:DNA-binding transcriptional LysR family regulator
MRGNANAEFCFSILEKLVYIDLVARRRKWSNLCAANCGQAAGSRGQRRKRVDEISNMAVFVKVVQAEGFTAAAAALNCSASSVSKRINQLEYEVGATLLNRSTHGILNLTEAGKLYFDRARKIIYEIENARDSVREVTQTLRGTLKVHMTPGTGLKIVLPVVLQFIKHYPLLSVEVSIRPEVVDIIKLGFDVSIRSGPMDESEIASFEARELKKASYRICASRSYFEEHGRPAHPRDLVNHNCLISARQPSPDKWWFRSERKKFSVKVRGNLIADNWTIIEEAARAGLGIARVLYVDSLGSLGNLETIFADMMISDRVIWGLVPRMSPMPRKIELFVNYLRKGLNHQVAGMNEGSRRASPLRKVTV